ncbi:MAG: DUF445 family protein [Thermodesulfobacteriota bacterium]
MPTLLHLAAPPLLGAIIGYTTNYVAIKMLFRPLRPWKILGIRLPMTPGVIPAKRHELARNIGEMVGDHLLTGQDVSRAIAGEQFRQKLHELITERVATLLHKDLGPIATIIPARFHSYFKAGVKIIRLRFITSMHSYLDSPDFARIIDRAATTQLDAIIDKTFSALFPSDNQEHFYRFLEQTVHELLASPDTREWIAAAIRARIHLTLREGRSLHDIIPSEISSLFLERLEEETPALLARIAAMLGEPVMREKIGDTMCRAVSGFTASLGPLAAMMASFISEETIRRKVEQYLADKGGEISGWLADETIRRETAQILRQRAENFLHRPLADQLAGIDPKKIDTISRQFGEQISLLLARPSTAASVANLLRSVLDSQAQRPLAAIIGDLFGPTALERGRRWTAAEITALFRSSKIKQILNDLVVELLEKKLLAKPIGRPADLLPRKVQLSFADYIEQQVADILVREVPLLVDSLDIKKIVTRKVDSLDLLRLEGLLMSIMQEQFKYINLFGALLGFLIGLANLLLLVR